MKLTILTGPPRNPEDDKKWVKHFFSLSGKKVISGGTTTRIVSELLDLEVEVPLTKCQWGMPPVGNVGGYVATEGVISLESLINQWNVINENRNLPSSKLKRMIHEASAINIIQGRGNKRKELVNQLIILIEQMGKSVQLEMY